MSKKDFFKSAKENILNGIFWSIGVTIGFAVVSTILIAALSQIVTVPVIGNFVAAIVEQTELSLGRR